ncbi:hypothetical protein Goklo_016574 [Gossypium klotzschianum]|uniref:Uncharacterized protein n=1 Tax=Gossypium klotzschianum TaxID=34286 RepID=A0A7J8UEN9_9ROSI|nr:hypothetical protein [Gossypium klotzschianum]
MTVVESMVKLGLGKDKLKSFKSEERGLCETNHKENVVDDNGNNDNSGNEKPRVGKKKPKRKRDKLKCFLCVSPHILKKFRRNSHLKRSRWVRPWYLVRAQRVSKPRRLKMRRS